eukprot:EG_transcript_10747
MPLGLLSVQCSPGVPCVESHASVLGHSSRIADPGPLAQRSPWTPMGEGSFRSVPMRSAPAAPSVAVVGPFAGRRPAPPPAVPHAAPPGHTPLLWKNMPSESPAAAHWLFAPQFMPIPDSLEGHAVDAGVRLAEPLFEEECSSPEGASSAPSPRRSELGGDDQSSASSFSEVAPSPGPSNSPDPVPVARVGSPTAPPPPLEEKADPPRAEVEADAELEAEAEAGSPGAADGGWPTEETRCAHRKSWKRLRAKKRCAFFVCLQCGTKWCTRATIVAP